MFVVAPNGSYVPVGPTKEEVEATAQAEAEAAAAQKEAEEKAKQAKIEAKEKARQAKIEEEERKKKELDHKLKKDDKFRRTEVKGEIEDKKIKLKSTTKKLIIVIKIVKTKEK